MDGEMGKARAHAYVAGRVQGVWFRATTVEVAHRIGGLTGWAKNLRDGRVEVVCEGERENVERLVKWLWEGPELAEVSGVEVTWGPATGGLSRFDVSF